MVENFSRDGGNSGTTARSHSIEHSEETVTVTVTVSVVFSSSKQEYLQKCSWTLYFYDASGTFL